MEPMPDPMPVQPPPAGALEVARLIDHTLLKPEATAAQIAGLCQEAVDHGFLAVCVNSVWAPLAVTELGGTGVRVAVTVGFPLGAASTAAKVAETAAAVAAGADEIDMVLSAGHLLAGDDGPTGADIAAVRRACPGAVLKVILETSLLGEDEVKRRACRIAVDAGADFVKTSTGFGAAGATVEDVRLMRATVGPGVGVKASGGIRTLAALRAMVAAGANRIGTSSGIAILAELRAEAAAGN